jgi:hypothetical protein
MSTARNLLPLRRGLISGLCWLAGNAGAAESRYTFDVLLDNKSIGQHQFRVVATPGGMEIVESEARFDVKFLGLTVYRYRHSAEEQWREGCLLRITARTSDNGRELAVRGERAKAGFRLDEPVAREDASSCVVTYAYWNLPLLLRGTPLLNPQTGEFDAVSIDHLGEQQIEVKGELRKAQHYRLRLRGPGLPIELWYAPDGQWLQLASKAAGNRRLLYRLAD